MNQEFRAFQVYLEYQVFQAYRVFQVYRESQASRVFQVFREFFDSDDKLIYSATLVYPGDMLEFDIEFTVEAEA